MDAVDLTCISDRVVPNEHGVQTLVADLSVHQAQAAVGACLVHLRRLTDSLRPFPSWTDNPPDPQRVADALREVGPQLLESFSGLQECQGNALSELRSARRLRLKRGFPVRQEPVTALGTSGWFYLSIACEKVEKAVEWVEYALSDDKPIVWLSHLEDTTGKEWVSLIHALSMETDDAVSVFEAKQPSGKGSTTVTEANQTAISLAKRKPEFVHGGVRDWAAAIKRETGKTCSIATVKATPLWRNTMEQTGRGKTRGKTPKAVGFTGNMEAVVGTGKRDEILNGLIAQQEADYEPSPVDDDLPAMCRQPKIHKRV